MKVTLPGARPLPAIRLGLAIAELLYAVAFRCTTDACDWVSCAFLLLLPLLAIQGVVFVVSIVRSVIATLGQDQPAAVVELLVAVLMVAVVPMAVFVEAFRRTCDE